MSDLESYNRSFEEHVLGYEEEADAQIQAFRHQCVVNFISKLTRQQQEWDATFKELLSQSREFDLPEFRTVSFAEKPSIKIIDEQPLQPVAEIQNEESLNTTQSVEEKQKDLTTKQAPIIGRDQVDNFSTKVKQTHDRVEDPFPSEALDYFTNHLAIKEFIRIQDLQDQNRQILANFNADPTLKLLKNDLNLFIRTQINAISNSNQNHLMSKVRMLVSLFSGQDVTFQDRSINAACHPQGQLFAMDLAARTFVTVGTRLVNSVPAIARSMATVINGIVNNNMPIFKDLVMGHLQERCPYIIPMYPKQSDFGDVKLADAEVKFKIACGYSYDMKTKILENEDKYLSRMRSMVLIFACILITQENKGQAWTWLASFLSLKPEPVITPTALQAFLQETSRTLEFTYRRQFKKLLSFISIDYIKMIEGVTKKPTERQPLIKLKNQLSEVTS